MLESFVMAMCIYGTEPACTNSVSAYYQQSGAQQVLEAKSKYLAERNPQAAALIGYSAMIYQQQFIADLGNGKSCSLNIKTNTINYKWGF